MSYYLVFVAGTISRNFLGDGKISCPNGATAVGSLDSSEWGRSPETEWWLEAQNFQPQSPTSERGEGLETEL